MSYYAVIDTNILVSALLSTHKDAATVQVVGRIFSGQVIPLFSREILNEYREVLYRDKFGFNKSTVSALLDSIEMCGKIVEPAPTGELLPDKRDLPFYEVAAEKQVDEARLVTGNRKHFPVRPFIVTAREFLEILDQ